MCEIILQTKENILFDGRYFLYVLQLISRLIFFIRKKLLTEFFQYKDPILLSKALADMIESYKKLQITRSFCISRDRKRGGSLIYSYMHTCD